MCGRYTIRRIDLLVRHGAMDQPMFDVFDERRIVTQFDVEKPFPLPGRYNIAPSQEVPVVRLNASDAKSLGLAKWGLIPSWTRGKPKLQPINARSETVATSSMFRTALERRRCLVPADGFYEWKRLSDSAKQPYYIRMRDASLFAFAGLWERWKPDEASEPIDTFTVLTTTPNPLMESIHDRMPVILPRAAQARWMDRAAGGKDVLDLLVPFDADAMEAYPVSSRVNSPRNDSAELVERVEV